MSAPEFTVRQARQDFFADSGFPTDGGYDDDWAEADFGPVRYRVPNINARSAALRRHDLHHLATGYTTDWRGEAEISAWELGSGVGVYAYAWLIALWGLFTGLLLHPTPTIRAFLRGRHSRNLYRSRHTTDGWMDQPVSALRTDLRVLPLEADPWQGRSIVARVGDVIVLSASALLAAGLGLLSLLPAALLIALAWRPKLPMLQCPLSCSHTTLAH